MASNTISREVAGARDASIHGVTRTIDDVLIGCAKLLASLKLTVMLFAMSIFIILIGTLAQVEMDMWEVMETYFLSWFTWIELQVFFPRSWFPNHQNIPGGFPFFGGAFIGAGLLVNLLSAHLTRFRVQARGGRLASGLIVVVVGTVLTAVVIISGHNHEGLQGEPPFAWTALWMVVKCALALLSVATIIGAFGLPLGREHRKVEQLLLAITGVTFGIVTAWLFVSGAYLGDAGMRILWQLIQALFVGFVLLTGCVLLFKKRGGVVLIHGGILLLMFGQFYVAKNDVEEQVTVEEGQTVAYARDIRQTELAIVDSSSEVEDKVVVIPKSVLEQSYRVRKHNSDSDRTGWLEGLANGISGWLLSSPYVDGDGRIVHSDLPFNVVVERYYKNANLKDAKEGDENLATAGTGKQMIAVPVKAASGTDSSGAVDLASAYVKFEDKNSSDNLGVYMLSQIASSQDIADRVEVGEQTYDVSLRFQRNYKPYQVTLLDVSKDDYLGTNTPRNYSSDIRLVDADRGTDRKIHIWMNNPLRYAGETFYQSGYAGPPDFPKESTTLSVVKNSGWMIPYVACGLVGVGMLYHFMLILIRFLNRQMGGSRVAGRAEAAAVPRKGSQKRKQARRRVGQEQLQGGSTWPRILVPAIFVALFAGWFIRAASVPSVDDGEFAIQEFGALPVIADGRVKPFDTLARNSLRVLSNRETFRGRMSEEQLKRKWDDISKKLMNKYSEVDAIDMRDLKADVDGTIALVTEKSREAKYVEEYVDKLTTERLPATRWLLDVIARPEDAERHKVIRIDNLEVLDTLGLERRKGFLYSVDEIRGGIVEFEKQVALARELDVEQMSTFQKKLLELDRRIRTYTRIGVAFQPPNLPPLPTQERFAEDAAAARRELRAFEQSFVRFMRGIDSGQPPLSVPVPPNEEEDDSKAGVDWQPYSKAWAMAYVSARMLGEEPGEALSHLNKIIIAYQQGEPDNFNDEVERYKRYLRRNAPEQLKSKADDGKFSLTAVVTDRLIKPYFGNFYGFEAYFNHVAPFFFCWWPYLFAFVLVAIAWLTRLPVLNRAAFWLIVFTLAIHTCALLARVYISGRPPVTNLYSSAVFIGWGGVVFGLALEWLFRIGIGNALAAIMGFSSLVIAHNLAGDGDTFTVLQAVLDTQFWLATHVISVTLGYMATFAAGLLGLAFVFGGLFSPALGKDSRQMISSMIYGTTCFAIIFSLIGTVLGGLWADDSWGRFWGWDPKENGALIIVLWNALILHARWDRMVRDRGLAVLAVGGNIVTAWSWFGVNELGVGLHSYGFTEGVLVALGLFNLGNLIVIGIGMLPTSMWWSYQAEERERVEAELAT